MDERGHDPCCAPSSNRAGAAAQPNVAATATSGNGSTDGMVLLPGGAFLMGTDEREGFPADGEGPVREVTLSAFWISATAVSNAEFARFVETTTYATEAERFGSSFVFGGLLPDDFPATRAVADAKWWREVPGACWRAPEGPQSNIDDRGDHPVCHVSWNDAMAYCAWSGLRLPTEAEWEYAARGGLAQRRYPWGDELTPGANHMCNIWQGTFPSRNTLDDGYFGTAPVDAFPANRYGLYNTSGNIWEWCSDWFSAEAGRASGREHLSGPASGSAKVIRGGSYLCHASYCNRYRVAARSSNAADSSTGHMGFRVARDA